MLEVDIISLFPDVFVSYFNSSILKRAQEDGLLKINLHNLRDWGIGLRKSVDDSTYGGGAGMILMYEPLAEAVNSLKRHESIVIVTSAKGRTFTQETASVLSESKHIIIICGRYEGIDERFIEKYADMELRVGDYVLTGGEIPAMLIVDATSRLLSGIFNKAGVTEEESFSNLSSEEKILEYPQYTRPEEIEGMHVPEVLLSGNHAEIAKWRELNKSKASE